MNMSISIIITRHITPYPHYHQVAANISHLDTNEYANNLMMLRISNSLKTNAPQQHHKINRAVYACE